MAAALRAAAPTKDTAATGRGARAPDAAIDAATQRENVSSRTVARRRQGEKGEAAKDKALQATAETGIGHLRAAAP